jgi:hypothetical protein
MEMWDEDYFNEDVQAYIQIKNDGIGEFQFGYVRGDIDGKNVKYTDGVRFEFSWEGADELDPISGCGWVKLKDKDTIKGEFRIHHGDDSTFLARKPK